MSRPTLVTPIEEERLLRVLWDDDHLSDYPFAYLRGWCPCAVCQGHGGERRFIHVENPQLVSISLVGNYALNPTWSDGHQTGIYTFEYLRDLCACSECQNENTKGSR
jgi:DUF971 family protein